MQGTEPDDAETTDYCPVARRARRVRATMYVLAAVFLMLAGVITILGGIFVGTLMSR